MQEDNINEMKNKLGDPKALMKVAKGYKGDDKDDMEWAADMIAKVDIAGLKTLLSKLDTAIRDEILGTINKTHWKKLGHTPIEEALDAKQRMKKKMAMKKAKAKIKIGKKKSAKKLKTPDKLKSAAMKKARDMVAKKMVKGVDKKDMSFSQRKSLEKKLDKKKGAIAKLAKKIKGKVKMADKERVKKARSKK
jgi:hypothetical protein